MIRRMEKAIDDAEREKCWDLCRIKKMVMKIYSSAEDAKKSKSQFYGCYICRVYGVDCVDKVSHENEEV